MKYNTGNPLGSADPRDLYDTAAVADNLVHGDEAAYTDRLGTKRKSWAGMEKDFDEFLANSGYVGTSTDGAVEDYAAGIEVTAYNQVIRDGGEFWRAAAGTELPYTTTGSGMPEGGAFVSVGDALLRQDLVQPVATFNSVADMVADPYLDAGRKARTLGYYTPGDGGGNDYEIVAGSTAAADGGYFIDLDNGYQAKALFSGETVNAMQWGGSTKSFHISPTGNDSSETGSSSDPWATAQAAFNFLQSIGTTFKGQFEIVFAAGTYSNPDSWSIKSLYFEDRLHLKGPDVGGHPNVPTAIIDGTTAATNIAVFDFLRIYFQVSDIKIQNYTAGSGESTGVLARDGSDKYLVNVHCDNIAGNATHFRRGPMCRIEGGIFENSVQGIRVDSNSYFQIGNNGVGPIYRNNSTAGCRLQESAQGIIVNAEFDANLNGILLNDQSRARVNASIFTNQTGVGVLLRGSSRWQDSGDSTFTGNAKNVSYESYSSELFLHQDAYSKLRVYGDVSSDSHTGNTTLTEIKTGWTIPASLLVDSGRKIKVVVYGSAAGAGGGKSVQIFFGAAGVYTLGPAAIPTGSVPFRIELDCWAAGGDDLKYSGITEVEGRNTIVSGGDRNFDLTIDRDVNVRVELSSAADSVTIDRFEVFLEG